ncbi:MAG: alpha/beta hydrolase, partial [Sutterellaceae bacterium]|nr:alpha/beta hydrolase [Sutterellaceae bacterium]
MSIKLKSALISAALLCAFPTFAADAQDVTKLIGYTPGVEVINLDIVRPQIDVISGIVYSQIKSTRAVKQLRMTLEIPRTTAKKPAIIYFPGGGFTSSDHEKFSEMRRALAEAGFVVAATEYRTVPTMFPALLHDAKAAVRFLRAHADEYGIDANKIAVLGDSAGGYLAQMTAVTNGKKEWDKGLFLHVSSDVQAAVTIYGISNLLNISEG